MSKMTHSFFISLSYLRSGLPRVPGYKKRVDSLSSFARSLFASAKKISTKPALEMSLDIGIAAAEAVLKTAFTRTSK